jgi:thiamine pyrophosphate-dependent acetolactate synthase large subunit-like protein
MSGPGSTDAGRMPLADSLAALHAVRQREIVVTTMGTAREWQKLGTHPLDFVLVPSSMGQATSVGLGIALSQPDRRVVVCNGDGSMLMNLGSLVTISAQAPANLAVLVFDNGIYEVTGGQPTAAAAAIRGDRASIDFAAVARACGFTSVWTFEDSDTWRREVRDVLAAPGPSFVHLIIEPDACAGPPAFPGPARERALAFRRELTRRD